MFAVLSIQFPYYEADCSSRTVRSALFHMHQRMLQDNHHNFVGIPLSMQLGYLVFIFFLDPRNQGMLPPPPEAF